MRLTYRVEAMRDVAEAYEWYENQRPGLGSGFQAAFLRLEELIAGQPQAFPVVHADVRRALLKRYPYAVYYRRLGERTVEIVACLHTRRDPRLIEQRVDPRLT